MNRLTVGDLADGWKQSKKPGWNKIYREKSAEAIVPECRDTMGRAEPKEVRVNESY